MNHLIKRFHCWHCASGSRKQYLLPCSNGILREEFNRLYWQISNKVAYSVPQNGSLAIGQGQVYMPHKHLWGKFNVPYIFNHCLDNQFRNASFDLQLLKLWILFTGHTSMAYNKWQWRIDLWFIKSTRHSLPSRRRPSTLVCQPGIRWL